MNDLLYKVQSRFLFHAHIRIKIPAAYDDAVFNDLFAVMETVDQKYNSYSPNSYSDQINQNAGHFVEVDDEMVSILNDVMVLSPFFEGGYDITVMPLIRLWGFYRHDVKSIPSEKEIKNTRASIDYRTIEINGNNVKIEKGQEIVTGSFLKAYAVDQTVSKMRVLGIQEGIINAGGSTICALNATPASKWETAVADPMCANAAYTIMLDNQCLSTSTQTETFVEINGERYGHILDPRTGYPSPNRLVCVTSERCMVGDIVSTGLFCETQEGFLDKLKRISEKYTVDGFLVDATGHLIHSPTFRYGYEKNAE